MLAVTLVRYVASVTANMNLIGERFFWYRYRVQCDCAFKIQIVGNREP